MRLSEHMSFLNKASVTRALREVPPGSAVTIDATHCVEMDYDVKEVIKDFLTRAKADNIEVVFEGLDASEIDKLPTDGH
jgi:carbonic anhydrase